jgi:hypothetical protein
MTDHAAWAVCASAGQGGNRTAAAIKQAAVKKTERKGRGGGFRDNIILIYFSGNIRF